MGADAVMAGVLFMVVGQLDLGDERWTMLWQAGNLTVLVGTATYVVLWVATLWFLGLYAIRARWTVAGELNDIVVASVIFAFSTMSFLFVTRLEVDRSFLVIVLVAQPFLTMTGRFALRSFFDRLRARGYDRCYLLVIGVGSEAQAFADAVERHQDLGIQVIGHLRAPDGINAVVTRPILGDGADLQRLFRDRVVDEVAICVGPSAVEWSQALIQFAADEGKTVRIPTTKPVVAIDLPTDELDGMLVRSYVHGPARLVGLVVKRSMDIVGGVLGLVFLSPVFAVIAIAIALRDGRPVLFHQMRVGLHGRPFQLHKFRTMVTDAEARLGAIEALSDTKGPAFTMRNDPRVTRFGGFLRRSSIDELPQLWNVVKGNMSLIGPRPAPLNEVAGYDIWHRRRLSMRPGITGLSQVRTRVDGHFDERAHLDLAYIDQWSLTGDAKILGRTISAVLGGMDHDPGA
jgi:exopolysaccharide biosynthesis polyprenyl glycosylphosphotransferase